MERNIQHGVAALWTRHRRRNTAPRLILPVLTALFVSYFGYHALYGANGLYSKHDIEHQTNQLQAKLDALTDRRKALQQQVALLSDGSVEKDMLDEQARRALNMAQPSELVILRPFGQ
jgi:cell division protein FtsB